MPSNTPYESSEGTIDQRTRSWLWEIHAKANADRSDMCVSVVRYKILRTSVHYSEERLQKDVHAELNMLIEDLRKQLALIRPLRKDVESMESKSRKENRGMRRSL